MLVFDYFFRLVMSVLQFLSLSKRTISNTLNINIKTNNGSTLSVHLDPKWDIKNVKEIVAPQLGLAPEEIKIIFAGKELHDSTVIEECDLGNQSILHAVKYRPSTKPLDMQPVEAMDEGSKSLCETLMNLQLSDRELLNLRSSKQREAKPAQFYIYCPLPCRSLQTGKLRVRCANCRCGAFILDRDPQNWEDVLRSHRIKGLCETCVTEYDGPYYSEFYFKCTNHTYEGEEDRTVPLYLIKSNIQQVPCLACTDVCDPVLVFPCSSGHVTCLDCFRTYCSTRLKDRQFWSHPEYGYTLGCPAGCPDSYIKEAHHFKLLTHTQYALYQRFGAEEYVLRAGGLLCPQPGCGMGILPHPSCTRVTCVGGCGFVFCRKCLQGYHVGECRIDAGASVSTDGDCRFNVDPNKAAQASWDEASKVAIRVTTKPCPKCRTPTERAGGCMHMVCTRPQCGFDWCWMCQTPWSRECMGSHWFG